jgi:hypothetical protein
MEPKEIVDCRNKNSYFDKRAAIRAGKTEMRIRKNQKQLYTYLCPHCLSYHLTHNPEEFDVKKIKIKYNGNKRIPGNH